MKRLTYVEIDIDVCANTYGVAPCTASLVSSPPSGTIKCFNCKSTCQDVENFTPDVVTLRFAVPASYLPSDIECIPSIAGIAHTPGILALGKDLGQRATLSVSFMDHRHSDSGAGYDPYFAERTYDPWQQGTYWGKFRARQPYLRGRALRYIQGWLGQALGDMETRHYVIETATGPGVDGITSIIAKDALKLADEDRSQAPLLSNGYLAANLTNIATTFNLAPSGIGNLEYPASGWVAIGGKEIVAFTRVADAMTITRAQKGTDAVAHTSEDRVQLVLHYQATPDQVLYNLLVTYCGIDPSWIPLTEWGAEVSATLGFNLTADIAEPTGVKTLINEICLQCAIILWWDELKQRLQLRVLRPVGASAQTIGNDLMRESTFTISDQPDTRLSQVWAYFGQRNPLRPVDEDDNFRSVVAAVDLSAEDDYGSPAIGKIFCRWIPAFGRSPAQRIAEIQLGRFRDPPKRVTFEMHRPGDISPSPGQVYNVTSITTQDPTGAIAAIPVQATRVKPDADRWQVEAEEMRFTFYDTSLLTERKITIDGDARNLNLRTIHDQIYPEIDPSEAGDLTVICIVQAGAVVGSVNTTEPAFVIGSWPAGLTVILRILGRIQGAGGRGSNGPTAGGNGGTAIYTRAPIEIQGNGELWSGGGGGGGASGIFGDLGGGGGAGDISGAGGPSGATSGTRTAGGSGASPAAGNGGGPGLAGGNGAASAGGARGNAIDGVSYCTITGTIDQRGATIN
jgi:hypothetical protein